MGWLRRLRHARQRRRAVEAAFLELAGRELTPWQARLLRDLYAHPGQPVTPGGPYRRRRPDAG